MPNNRSHTFLSRMSISTRMAIGYSLGLFVMLSLFAFLIYQVFHQAIHNNFDRHLTFEANQIAPFVTEKASDSLVVKMSGNSRNEALMQDDTSGTFVRVYNRQHELQYVSPNLEQISARYESRIPEVVEKTSFSQTWQGLPTRTLYYPLKRDNEFIGWLEVTGFEWALHEQVSTIINYLVIIILISVLFSLLGGYILSNRALIPISSIIKSARSIHYRDLNQRLPVKQGVRDELTDLSETFNAMLDRLQRGFSREQQFTSDAAHELKTPLSSLRTETDIILRKDRNPEEYQQALLRIQQEVERMSKMVHLLLELSRLESRDSLSFEKLDLCELAQNVIGRVKSHADEKSLHIDCRTYNRNISVYGHTGYLSEALNNLLNNAVKYTPSGGSITVDVQNETGGARILVEDTGIGFNPEQKEHLYDRFYRSERQEVRNQAGSGLGLSLVKSIVEMHGGRIEAHSDGLNQGSRFILHLPYNAGTV